jgi:hypothetical protein
LRNLIYKGGVLNIIGNKPDYDEPLWRYFKTDYFVDIMQTSTLYFSSACQFDDSFEGAVAVFAQEFPVDSRYSEPTYFERAFEELRRLTKISCWHRASYESDAIWKLYADKGKGIAIQTNFESIRSSVQPFRIKPEYDLEKLWAGNVNYVDLLKKRLNVDMIERFWYKHLAFESEKEFRIAVSLRIAEEFGVAVPEDGVNVKFNLEKLVHRIYLGPSLSTDEIKKVRSAAETRGLADRIEVSSLLGLPRYT